MKLNRTLLISTLILLVQLSLTNAAVDYYLKIDGIDGEAKDTRHERKIEILSFSHEIAGRADAGSGLPTGKRQHKPFVITKPVDKATPLLMDACTRNKVLKSAKLELYRPNATGNQELYYVIELKNVYVTSIVLSNSLEGEISREPMVTETISFTYEEIEWSYPSSGASTTDNWRQK